MDDGIYADIKDGLKLRLASQQDVTLTDVKPCAQPADGRLCSAGIHGMMSENQGVGRFLTTPFPASAPLLLGAVAWSGVGSRS